MDAFLSLGNRVAYSTWRNTIMQTTSKSKPFQPHSLWPAGLRISSKCTLLIWSFNFNSAVAAVIHSLHDFCNRSTKPMEALINPNWFCSPCLNSLLAKRRSIYYPTFFRNRTSSLSRILLVKCSSEERTEGNLKNALSGMVDKRVEELLNREENRALLDDLDKASQRVEMARKELAEIERQQIEAAQLRDYVNQLESRASEIAECQKEILEAKAMVEEAERSLSINMNDLESAVNFKDKENEGIDKGEERWESIKAASISAIVGTIAGLPISVSQVSSSAQLILPLAITFISCSLFGVTFRYTIRRDLDNIQLKTGTSAAFSFVKGLGALGAGPPLELDIGSFLSRAVDSAVYVSENLFIFAFSAVALDFCFKMRLLSPFPIKKSVTRTNTR